MHKAKAKFKFKENMTKNEVPFAAKAFIRRELDQSEQISVLTKTYYRELASPTVYVKKNK